MMEARVHFGHDTRKWNPKDGDLPYQLGNLSQLTYLDLSGNSFCGALPYEDGNLPLLHTLGLEDTDIQSLFHSYSNLPTSLIFLDLSVNMLTSSTFQFLSNFSLNLQQLDLSRNNIVLSSPVYANFPSLNSLSSLVFLDLSLNLLKSSTIFYWLFNSTTNLRVYIGYNLLEGVIPDGFGKVMKSLEVLDLYDNKLQGEIPSFLGNICTLQRLGLSNNKLNGEISSFIQNSSWCNRHVFRSLFLSYNRITGMLPASIGLLSELEYLSLEGNYLEGEVTESHLSNFSKLRSYSAYMYVYKLYTTLMWKGVERRFPDPELNLKSIHLSYNKLTGKIPKEIGDLLGLVSLNLSRNNLRGEIPSEFGNLSSLDSLGLSRNHFSGKIPSSLSQIDGISKLDLSHNSLSGRIPSGSHFETFEASSFEGNIDLCGEQLNKSCPGDGDGDEEQ
ncbi:unnamed protein product [Sphenostylis stenocarpa]|uniref:Uncharacterized protein n=1 Tax=Sphenostylis stenocarpa TaxID=92480 RepID=A0AA86VPH3_9FABA|nr:unnamed protein product [Sphenostylis stenocarpa]